MAAPAASVIDNFNRASLGANWSTFTQAGTALTIVSSTLLAPGSNNYTGSYWNAATFSRPCEAYMTIVSGITGTTNYCGLMFIDTPNNTETNDDGYYLGTDTGDIPDSVKLYRVDNGVATQIPAGTEHASSIPDNSRWAIQLEATNVKLWSDEGSGWVERISTADTTYSPAFRVVIDIFDPGSDNVRLDDLGAGAIAGAATTSLIWRPPSTLRNR